MLGIIQWDCRRWNRRQCRRCVLIRKHLNFRMEETDLGSWIDMMTRCGFRSDGGSDDSVISRDMVGSEKGKLEQKMH